MIRALLWGKASIQWRWSVYMCVCVCVYSIRAIAKSHGYIWSDKRLWLTQRLLSLALQFLKSPNNEWPTSRGINKLQSTFTHISVHCVFHHGNQPVMQLSWWINDNYYLEIFHRFLYFYGKDFSDGVLLKCSSARQLCLLIACKSFFSLLRV